MAFASTWDIAGKMRRLPGVPRASQGRPPRKAIVGAMLLTDRREGPTLFRPPGRRSMSEMSSFSRIPHPGTRTPDPKKWPMVWLIETTVPERSTIVKWVVLGEPDDGGPP